MIYPHFHQGKPQVAVRSRLIANGNGLNMHVVEAGFETANRPCVLLLHGFPELAFSWRKVLPALAAAGFYAVAPDQRGYGRTTGWDGRYDGDVGSFHLLNLVKDMVGLVSALQLQNVASVIGHDFGAPVAAWCALLHPEIFRSAILLSAPFGGPGVSSYIDPLEKRLAQLRSHAVNQPLIFIDRFDRTLDTQSSQLWTYLQTLLDEAKQLHPSVVLSPVPMPLDNSREH